jgi:membrane-bound lytic murein transglycosylase F
VQTERWRPLIADVVRRVWPDFMNGARWIEAQVTVESAGDPDAVSPVGAVGLMQLMPGTAAELGVRDPRDPQQNLVGGVTYLRRQFEHFPEIPEVPDRLRWSWAAYNGGRGYCNKALSLARRDEIEDRWRWSVGRHYLFHRECEVATRRPDYRQMWDYVDRIEYVNRLLMRVA